TTMKIAFSRAAAALAMAAALSLAATPAMARGYGDWGHHHRHRGGGVDAGDVFAGLLIIGGIAAIASAASKQNRDQRERDVRYPAPDYREPSGRYGDYPDDRAPPGYGGVGLNEAVDTCVGEVERGR